MTGAAIQRLATTFLVFGGILYLRGVIENSPGSWGALGQLVIFCSLCFGLFGFAVEVKSQRSG